MNKLIILEKAVEDDKVMQDFDLESLTTGGAFTIRGPQLLAIISQKIALLYHLQLLFLGLSSVSEYKSKDWVNLSSSTAFSML